MFRNPEVFGRWMMWHYAYLDARNVFAHKKLGIIQEEIDDLCKSNDTVPCTELRVAPVDPSSSISHKNIALVRKEGRSLLIKTWKTTKDADLYKQVLSKNRIVGSSA